MPLTAGGRNEDRPPLANVERLRHRFSRSRSSTAALHPMVVNALPMANAMMMVVGECL
jgi:hypothetical protein